LLFFFLPTIFFAEDFLAAGFLRLVVFLAAVLRLLVTFFAAGFLRLVVFLAAVLRLAVTVFAATSAWRSSSWRPSCVFRWISSSPETTLPPPSRQSAWIDPWFGQ
jgi:hypothetical protein